MVAGEIEAESRFLHYKRNEIVLLSVDKQEGRIILRDIKDGTGFAIELRFFLLRASKELHDDLAVM